MDRFFFFNLPPMHGLGLLLGSDSVSLAGVGVGRERAKGRKRKPRMDENLGSPLAGPVSGCSFRVCGKSSSPWPSATWVGGRLHGVGFRSLASSQKLWFSSPFPSWQVKQWTGM